MKERVASLEHLSLVGLTLTRKNYKSEQELKGWQVDKAAAACQIGFRQAQGLSAIQVGLPASGRPT